MQVFFTSDLHIGHNAINKYRPQFSTALENHQYMLELFASLKKRNIVYVLGDFLFHGEHYQPTLDAISKMHCNVKLLLGNHDSLYLYRDLPHNIELQLPFYSYKQMWLSHCPIHPHEMRNRLGNVHGHMHLETLNDPFYFNANIDVNNYQFVPLETIKQFFASRTQSEPNSRTIINP